MRTTTRPGATGTLVLDFDGTVCLGDDPVRLYCEEVIRVLDQATGARITASLDGFLDGHPVAGLEESQDGYQAVQRLAAGVGVLPAQLDVAYRDSRRRFDAGEGQAWVPDGLLEELAAVRARGVDLILVTNAPMLGVRAFAERTGLAEHLTGVVPDAGKPTGMAPILQRLLEQVDHRSERLMSVGDVWANDIEPALGLGCAAAYIDRFRTAPDEATATAPTIQGLYPVLRAWARG